MTWTPPGTGLGWEAAPAAERVDRRGWTSLLSGRGVRRRGLRCSRRGSGRRNRTVMLARRAIQTHECGCGAMFRGSGQRRRTQAAAQARPTHAAAVNQRRAARTAPNSQRHPPGWRRRRRGAKDGGVALPPPPTVTSHHQPARCRSASRLAPPQPQPRGRNRSAALPLDPARLRQRVVPPPASLLHGGGLQRPHRHRVAHLQPRQLQRRRLHVALARLGALVEEGRHRVQGRDTLRLGAGGVGVACGGCGSRCGSGSGRR
mmetsp:Transcript_4179/g.17642  ORF Transcript_4179/g.17642 Transcript_4179/m.17642 type:complete len:260 (-) Transcript_4179:1744-2523(-)